MNIGRKRDAWTHTCDSCPNLCRRVSEFPRPGSIGHHISCALKPIAILTLPTVLPLHTGGPDHLRHRGNTVNHELPRKARHLTDHRTSLRISNPTVQNISHRRLRRLEQAMTVDELRHPISHKPIHTPMPLLRQWSKSACSSHVSPISFATAFQQDVRMPTPRVQDAQLPAKTSTTPPITWCTGDRLHSERCLISRAASHPPAHATAKQACKNSVSVCVFLVSWGPTSTPLGAPSGATSTPHRT